MLAMSGRLSMPPDMAARTYPRTFLGSGGLGHGSAGWMTNDPRRTFYWNGRTRIKYDVLECSTGSEKKEWCYYQASRPSPINSGVLIYPKK